MPLKQTLITMKNENLNDAFQNFTCHSAEINKKYRDKANGRLCIKLTKPLYFKTSFVIEVPITFFLNAIHYQ